MAGGRVNSVMRPFSQCTGGTRSPWNPHDSSVGCPQGVRTPVRWVRGGAGCGGMRWREALFLVMAFWVVPSGGPLRPSADVLDARADPSGLIGPQPVRDA